MKEIYHCLWINAPVEVVFRAITDREGLAGWWTRDLEVGPAPGTLSTFRFKSGSFNKMEIRRIDPQLVEWKCVDGHEEWKGSRVRFELRRQDDRTKLCFSHENFREQTEYIGECSFHWANYLVSLRALCETGTGNPDEGMQNR